MLQAARVRLPRAVIPIFGTTLADVLGYTLMIPLLPAFAERYGASDVMVGALLSVPAFCSMLAAPIWGALSDRLGRKRIILISQIFSFTGYCVLALSNSLGLIFASRIISGIGGGNMGALQSYIADVTAEEQRSYAYSVYGAVFGAGFIVGPVASGFLAQHGAQFPFLVAAGLVALNFTGTSLFLPWQPRTRHPSRGLLATLKAANLPHVRRVFVRQFLFIFGITSFLGTFALYLNHALHRDVTSVSWLLAGAGAIGALTLAFVSGPLAARIGARQAGQAGFGFLLVAYGLLVAVDDLGKFMIVIALWAIGAALVTPTLMALLSERAPLADRGALMGASDSINSIALILGPQVGTAMLGLGTRYAGVIPALAMIAALLIGHEWKHRTAPGERGQETRRIVSG